MKNKLRRIGSILCLALLVLLLFPIMFYFTGNVFTVVAEWVFDGIKPDFEEGMEQALRGMLVCFIGCLLFALAALLEFNKKKTDLDPKIRFIGFDLDDINVAARSILTVNPSDDQIQVIAKRYLKCMDLDTGISWDSLYEVIRECARENDWMIQNGKE